MWCNVNFNKLTGHHMDLLVTEYFPTKLTSQCNPTYIFVPGEIYFLLHNRNTLSKPLVDASPLFFTK